MPISSAGPPLLHRSHYNPLPLLANLYLHWFDALFHGPQGPARRADVKLVRYADDFVARAKQMGSETVEFIESRLERKLQLEINREKTRVVDLREQGASLNFLGYTFRRSSRGSPSPASPSIRPGGFLVHQVVMAGIETLESVDKNPAGLLIVISHFQHADFRRPAGRRTGARSPPRKIGHIHDSRWCSSGHKPNISLVIVSAAAQGGRDYSACFSALALFELTPAAAARGGRLGMRFRP